MEEEAGHRKTSGSSRDALLRGSSSELSPLGHYYWSSHINHLVVGYWLSLPRMPLTHTSFIPGRVERVSDRSYWPTTLPATEGRDSSVDVPGQTPQNKRCMSAIKELALLLRDRVH